MFSTPGPCGGSRAEKSKAPDIKKLTDLAQSAISREKAKKSISKFMIGVKNIQDVQKIKQASRHGLKNSAPIPSNTISEKNWRLFS